MTTVLLCALCGAPMEVDLREVAILQAIEHAVGQPVVALCRACASAAMAERS